MSKKRSRILFLTFGVLILTVAVIVSIIIFGNLNKPVVKNNGKEISARIESTEDIIKFAGELGWAVSEKPQSVKKIIIPLQFNDLYSNYNDLQKEIGLDLQPYAGKECQYYSFSVNNYPNNKDVTMNIIVYGNRIIGGDISENIYKGFMYGLSGSE